MSNINKHKGFLSISIMCVCILICLASYLKLYKNFYFFCSKVHLSFKVNSLAEAKQYRWPQRSKSGSGGQKRGKSTA